MAADAFVHTLPADRLLNRKAFMWIDNLSAKYALQKGYSKVGDTGKVVNSFKFMHAKRQLRVWFEYVPSEQNIAYLPSRRRWRELHRVIDSVSRGAWTCFRYDVVIPSSNRGYPRLAATVQLSGGGTAPGAQNARVVLGLISLR